MSRLNCKLFNLATTGKLTDYELAWKFQKAIAERAHQDYKLNGKSVDSILLVQHPSIYTLGRGATPDNIKFDADYNCRHKVVRIERGGEVTWHGPGQLVAYPILNLNNHKRDLHWLTTQLEQTVIDTLQNFGIVGERSDVNTGVWVGKNKISAVGLTASRWITMHGIALNVNCDLAHFEEIVPCGITQSDRGVCSIQGLHNTLAGHLSGESFALEDESQVSPAEAVDVGAVATHWMASFGKVFQMDIEDVARDTTNTTTTSSISNSTGRTEGDYEETIQQLHMLVQQYPKIAESYLEHYPVSTTEHI